MNTNLKIGDKVKVLKMPNDSFYKQVIGNVEDIRNGYIRILATEVMSKWDSEFKPHPGCGCSTGAKIENIVKI